MISSSDYTLPNWVLNANQVSTPLRVKHLNRLFFSIAWTGTPTGTFTIEFSGHPVTDPGLVDTTTFQTLPNSALAVAGAAGSQMWSGPVDCNWIRLKYTFTSGTGNVTYSYFNGKALGGS